MPSIRAGNYLKKTIQASATQARFLPEIITIETFIKEVSDLEIIQETPLLFAFYEVYLEHTPKAQQESFNNFSNWASTLLGDFNELDRYLVSTDSFFDYLYNIQELNHWSTTENQTPLIQSYLAFWKHLPKLYNQLYTTLKSQGVGYQGMVYREAADAISFYAQAKKNTAHAFLGFNALNNAEQSIFQELLGQENTHIYWDADTHFINDSSHSASLFMRRYFNQWNYYKEHAPLFVNNNYADFSKQIQIIQAPNGIGQIKHIGVLLEELSAGELNNTAIVLANEALLVPLLNSLPEHIKEVNITMGVSLGATPLMQWIDAIFKLHQNAQNGLYYKHVFKILGHPAGQQLIPHAQQIINKITSDNQISLTLAQLEAYAEPGTKNNLNLLFESWPKTILDSIKRLSKIAASFLDSNKPLQRTAANKILEVLQVIQTMQERYNSILELEGLQTVINQLASRERLNYRGDAYKGLQIMGVLESRALDFDTVIMASVNEGIIPSGKTANSFITTDLKKQYELPSFFEKDAIFTYHFYRVLHRAKNVHLLYSAVSGGLQTSEMSRLIKQMLQEQSPHNITQQTIVPKLELQPQRLKEIPKNEDVLSRLQKLAQKGISASALTTYIRNPFDFYSQKILGIRQADQIEEDIAYNTLGSIVHEVLESLYKPLEGHELTVNHLKDMELKIPALLQESAQKLLGAHFFKGKNRIVFEVAKQYVLNALQEDLRLLKTGSLIQILAIEGNYNTTLSIPSLAEPIKLHGIIDRVDQIDGQTRVLDYKTGSVMPNQLAVANWEELTTDYKFSKAFQVLFYSLLYCDTSGKLPNRAGIISFKNMGNGFMSFKSKTTNSNEINLQVLTEFKTQLKALLAQIYDPEQLIIEKEV